MEPDQERNVSEVHDNQSRNLYDYNNAVDKNPDHKDVSSEILQEESLQNPPSQTGASESLDLRVEEVMDQRNIGKTGSKFMQPINESIYNKCFKAYKLFAHYYMNHIQLEQSNENKFAIEDLHDGIHLLGRLIDDKALLQKDLKVYQDQVFKKGDLILTLEREKDTLLRKNAGLEERIQDKERRLRLKEDQDGRKFRDLKDGYTRHIDQLQEKVNQSEQQLLGLSSRVYKLDEDRANLQKLRDELEADKSKLMTELARYQRDKSSTYQAGDRPQNYMLAQEYKTLQEQYLDRLAGNILSTFGDRLPILQEGDRKRKLNRVKSMLSRSILIVGQAIINGEVGALPKPKSEILNMVYVNISQRISFPADSPYADAFKDEIEHLLSTGLSLASGKVQYPKSEEWQEKDFSLATQEITNEVYKNFEIRDIDKAVEQELQNTIKECLQFLQKTALADPPGLLSIETEGEAFNSDRHEIAKGCPEESGQVLETIYPFYLDNGTVRTKAIVWLEPNSTNLSNDSGSQASKTQTSETKPDEVDVKNKTQESAPKSDENDNTVSTLRGMLINTLSFKKFSEHHPTHASEGIHSTEYEILEGIKKQILEITDVKNLEGLNGFLINTAKSLNDFHTEINRVTSNSSNN
jgi:hypothetical protein